MFLVDANVLLDISTDDPRWKAWSLSALEDALANGPTQVNPLIYAEVALDFEGATALNRWLREIGIERVVLPYSAAFPASRAFRRYRRAGGPKRSPLPDFYIGAHAAVAGLTLITRDVRRYRSYFPSVRLIAPREETPQ